MRPPTSAIPALGAAALMLACAGDPQTAPDFAKGPPAPTTVPVVTAAEPAVAPRDTTLDVKVTGSGFDNGSRVDFAIGGVVDPRLRVNSTAYRKSTELVANVTVAVDAALASYDVQVTTTRGKKGIGSEIFVVVEGNPSSSWAFPLDDAALAFRSDGAFALGGESFYRNGECGATGVIFFGSGSGDNVQTTDGPKRDRSCAAWPRRITVVYPDGVQQTAPFRANLLALQLPPAFIPIGTTVRRGLNFVLAHSSARCDVLRYAAIYQQTIPIAADSLDVTRIDATTWDVSTQPAPNDRAYCTTTGESFSMPIRFRVIASRPLGG